MAVAANAQLTITLEDIPEIKRVVESSIAYRDCIHMLLSTHGASDLCTDKGYEWELAITAYKEAMVNT